MARRAKKNKLPPEIRSAIDDKIEVLTDMAIVNRNNEDIVRRRFELAIETQPERDPYVIMDQLAHTYMEDAWNG